MHSNILAGPLLMALVREMAISFPDVRSAGSTNLWKRLNRELLFSRTNTWFCVHTAHEYLDLCTTNVG
jgi:hypothetical protein